MTSTIPVSTQTGPINFHYCIATPSNARAESIDPSLPTLLFIPPEYLACESWQNQFSSSLRRFNLVTFDLRGHGITGGDAPLTYSRKDAARDVASLMDALELPSCHIIGNSVGSDIALELAIAFPEKAASLTLIGVIPDIENADVTAGRQEIFDLWQEGCLNSDEQACADAVWGCLQLLYNNMDVPLARALLALNMPKVQKNWGPDQLSNLRALSVEYFVNDRAPRQTSELAKITCPILIIHPTEDIIVPSKVTEELQASLQAAGVSVQKIDIDGAPRFAPVTHPKPVNAAIEQFIISRFCPNQSPPIPQALESPWEQEFRDAGYSTSNFENLEDESDDSDNIIDHSD